MEVLVRGKSNRQSVLFVAAIDLESRVRPGHPLRAIKRMTDQHLGELSRRFDIAYSREGRPSVPPERLLKAMMLQALYSVPSEAQLVERIDHDLLFRWFLDMRIDEPVFDATVFSHNRRRLEEHGLIAEFFDSTVRRAISQGLVSDEHFSVDGSLIEAHASIKSFKRRDRGDDQDDDKGDHNAFKSRNPDVDFRGEKRSNDTHASTTDPDAKLYRKADGQPSRLCHALHALAENRHGLVLAIEVNAPTGNSEPKTAVSLIDRVRRKFKLKPKTVGADRGYDQGPFLRDLERRRIVPHVAPRRGPVQPKDRRWRKKNRANIAARRRLRRRTRGVRYKLSQRCRKKIEECFGWIKTVGGLARTRLIGHWRTRQQAQLGAAAYNLIRMRNLAT